MENIKSNLTLGDVSNLTPEDIKSNLTLGDVSNMGTVFVPWSLSGHYVVFDEWRKFGSFGCRQCR